MDPTHRDFLTRFELEVLSVLSESVSFADAASKMRRSPNTLNSAMDRVRRKTNLAKTHQIVAWAFASGLLPLKNSRQTWTPDRV